MRILQYFICLACFGASQPPAAAPQGAVDDKAATGSFAMRRAQAVSGSIEQAQGAGFSLRASLGQAEAGTAASAANWRLTPGYWPGLPPSAGAELLHADGFE